ncbi:MAG: hypothetical protein KAR42_04285 [candidate division Zixibacteria bacterium]|nr:hypothetical protein [candidate division Zixibacteria bacterium]
MRLSSRNVCLLAMLLMLVLAVFGCTQKDDVLKPQNKATLTLRPTYLPELESIYNYEFWALTIDGNNDSTFTSLGKFNWDNTLYRFMDVSGNAIDNEFELPELYSAYDYFLISIEDAIDAEPAAPSGTFILMDEVVDPVTRPISMKFPSDLFGAQGSFMLATPTDDTLDQTNETKGVWLCSQVQTPRSNHDTLGISGDSILYGSLADTLDGDSLVPDIVGVLYPTDSLWTIINSQVVFGYDTLPHRSINVEWITEVHKDSNFTLSIDYIIDNGYDDDSNHINIFLGEIYYYNYLPTVTSLPDVSQYGWQYNTWIFHEYFPASANIPQMVPFGYKMQGHLTAMPDWGVIELGAFSVTNGIVDSADITNRYGDNREVPNFPGEDFIVNLPAGYDELEFTLEALLDSSSGKFGVVVVGLEPLTTNVAGSDRNFPLFFLSGDLPTAEQYDPSFNSYTFHNWSQSLPKIDISVTFSD